MRDLNLTQNSALSMRMRKDVETRQSNSRF